jgi:hypothetical protein
MDKKNVIVWVDDASPARKIGSWPFHSTINATEPRVWVGYDAVTGRARHSIVKATVGYNIRTIRNNTVDVNCMTLEHAQQYCENN